MSLLHKKGEWYIDKKYAVLLFCWSLLVLPLCYFGFGSDEDAWAVGEEASIMWDTHTYSISRSTGFPLHELLTVPLVKAGGWYAANFFSYICGLILAYFLLGLIKENHFKNPVWVFAGVMFLPQVIINASSTIDYMPSLALFAGAYYFFVKKRFDLLALLVGISCGFRPSNGIFILPFVCAQFIEDRDYSKSMRMFLVAFITGLVAYSPVLLKYGILNPTREVEVPLLQNILIGGYQALILFGIWQSVVLGIMFVYYFFAIRNAVRESLYNRFHIVNILLWVTCFVFITSSEAEYLFPVIFSVIFLLDTVVDKKHFQGLVVVLLSYNIFSLEMLGGESGNRTITVRPEWGFTIRDLQDRRFKLWYREATTNFKCEKKTLLMYGFIYVKAGNDQWEYSDLAPGMVKQKNGNFYLSERILEESVLKALKAQGFDIYVWNNRKWEYITLKKDFWTLYVKIVYDLEQFLGSRQYGRLIQ